MAKITTDNITQEQLLGLLQVLDMHLKILNKINPKDLGFLKRQAFNTYKTKIKDLYEELDNI